MSPTPQIFDMYHIGNVPVAEVSYATSYDELVRHTLEDPSALLVAGFTAAGLAALGDLVAQAGEETKKRQLGTTHAGSSATLGFNPMQPNKLAFLGAYDAQRGFSYASFGFLYTGVFQHVWFESLNTHLAPWLMALNVPQAAAVVASPIAFAVTKLSVNQFIVVPLLYMPLFFAFTGYLGGLSTEEMIRRFETLCVPTLKRNYAFWLPTQFFMFLAVPSEYQVLYICIAGVVWTAILSSLTGTASTSKAWPETPQALEVTFDDAEEALAKTGTVAAVGAIASDVLPNAATTGTVAAVGAIASDVLPNAGQGVGLVTDVIDAASSML